MIPIFIGYDPREAIVFHTCVNSIIRNASKPVSIIPLALNLIPDYTEKHTDGSNQFTYSRFLVPYLSNFSGLSIYLDGDMVVNGDISELYNIASKNPGADVHVVKHDYKTKQSVKYFDAKNEDYPRKNWSSVMVFNCSNLPTRQLTPQYVQRATGAHLHRFGWTTDERIGELPIDWNWLPDEFGSNSDAKILHWTLGAPCFDEFKTTEQASVWHHEHKLANNARK